MIEEAMPRLIIQMPDGSERTIDLPKEGEYSARIGRLEHCDICLPLQSVSSEHALLQLKDGHYVIEDLNSTNGVKINGMTPVGAATLHEGDSIRLGDAYVVFTIEQDVADTPNEDADAPKDEATEPNPPPATRPNLQALADRAEKKAWASYIWMVFYALLMFCLAVTAGMTYKHYKVTGELLPLQWMGKETPKESFKALQENLKNPPAPTADEATEDADLEEEE